MPNDERNPKLECRRALRFAIAGFVIRVSSFLRNSSFVIRICEEFPPGIPLSTPVARPSTFSRDELVLSEAGPTGTVLAGFRRDSQSHAKRTGPALTARSAVRDTGIVLPRDG